MLNSLAYVCRPRFRRERFITAECNIEAESEEVSKEGRKGGEEIHVIFPLPLLFLEAIGEAKARRASRTTSPSMNYAAWRLLLHRSAFVSII